MSDEPQNQIILASNEDLAITSGVGGLMQKIRPEWRSKNLVERVSKLLPIDPSSACQRLFNASIHDLKKKILIAGLDIAKEAAQANRLPAIQRPEDIEEYNVSKTIDLAYYMGILTRPEWRRVTRVYDIRRDLEHEDDEYEATIEDCFYIFKTSIETVLSRDPIQVIKLVDIKAIIEQASAITLDQTVREEYKIAPAVRQVEIYKFLFSTSLNSKYPDVVRQNCYIALGTLCPLTQDRVKIEVSEEYSEKVKRSGLDVITARVGFVSGVLPYFKKSVLKDFYSGYNAHMRVVGYDFTKVDKHGNLIREFQEVGGLTYCHDDLLEPIVEWLCLCYIGQRSFGRYSDSRKVFFSNTGAPLAREVLSSAKDRISNILPSIITSSKEIAAVCQWSYCQRRAQELIDVVS